MDQIWTRINELAEANNGFVRTAQVEALGISRPMLRKYTDAGKLEQVRKGLYVLADGMPDEYALLQGQCRDAVFSYGTALYLWGLSDRTPHIYDITIPRDKNISVLKRDNPNLRCHYLPRDVYEIGITQTRSPQGAEIKLYDKEIIEKMAKNTGLSAEYIEDNEQKRNLLDNFNSGYYIGLNNDDELFIKESELIKELSTKDSCVIVGRCADFVLKDNKNVLKVFISSSMDNKIKRATEFYGMNRDKAEKEIFQINKLRANHYKYYTERDWKDPSNYDICINSDAIGIDNTVNLICSMAKEYTGTNNVLTK